MKTIHFQDDIKIVTSFSDKLLGLLKKSNPRFLMFETRFGIHTFGLKKIIEVIVLDQNLKVVKIGTVKQNRMFFWNPKYFWVVETPQGIVNKYQIKISDKLQISNFITPPAV